MRRHRGLRIPKGSRTRVKGVKVRAYCRRPGGLRGFLRRETKNKSMPF